MPWVRDASVRRIFPGTLEITLVAHRALARWNEDTLVSEAGEVFRAESDAALPHLRGPVGAAGRVAAEYRAIAGALAPLQSPVVELRLSPRGAWFAVLGSGLAIALGRGEWRPRAARLVSAWPRLAPEAREARYADLRYPGGFALRRAAEATVRKP